MNKIGGFRVDLYEYWVYQYPGRLAIHVIGVQDMDFISLVYGFTKKGNVLFLL